MDISAFESTLGISFHDKSLLSRARLNLREVLEPYLESGSPPGAEPNPAKNQ